jgi:hypothetical protein
MLSGLSGLVPGTKPAEAAAPAQRTPDAEKNGAGDKPVGAKTTS